MKSTELFFLTNKVVIVSMILFFSANLTQAQSNLFPRSLKVGMHGEDVRNLQKILNLSPETAISPSGPGSNGQETVYFGKLTREAVIRFQEKYKNEILVPNGLFVGTGFVGPSTIAMLNQIGGIDYSKIQNSYTPAVSTELGTIVSTSSRRAMIITNPTSSVSTKDSPNTKELDLVFEAIDRIGQQQGFSAEQLRLAKQVVTDQAATTTNLNEKFIETITSSISIMPQPLRSTFSGIWGRLKDTIYIKNANAIIGTPFGGRLLFSMYCTNSQNWWIGVQPLPPSFATLLTYETGTQIYLSNNIPMTSNLLGRYGLGKPCIQGACPGCVTMPSQGRILPATGSSPI